MPTLVIDDFTSDISPDKELGNTSGGVTLSNPNLDATDWIVLRDLTLEDNGSPRVAVFHCYLGINNPESSAQELSGGVFTNEAVDGAESLGSEDNDLSGAHNEVSLTYDAVVAALVTAAEGRGDKVTNNVASRPGVTIYEQQGGLDIREINVPAGTKRYYLIETLAILGASAINTDAIVHTFLTGAND